MSFSKQAKLEFSIFGHYLSIQFLNKISEKTVRRIIFSRKEIYYFHSKNLWPKTGMKNRILKGICSEEEKSDCEKENTVQNRFQTFKAAGTATQLPAAVPWNRAARSLFCC